MFRRWVGGLVDAAGRHPAIVLVLAVLFMAGSWNYARKLELRSDFLELLPRDSPGFKAFEHQLGRVGGGATFLVVVESPDRKANEAFVDELGGALEKQADDRTACVKACAENDGACKAKCGPDFISYVEKGTKDLQAFFDHRQWLYATQKELEEADDTLDHQISGVSQQQGGNTSLTFSSQYGTVSTLSLPLISGPGLQPAAPTNFADNQAFPVAAAPAPQSPPTLPPQANNGGQSSADLLVILEKLGHLRDAGFLTEDEFQAKKSDLLSRL